MAVRLVRDLKTPADQSTELNLTIYGMRDTTAAQTVYGALANVEGIRQVHLDIGNRRARIIHAGDPDLTARICGVLNGMGFLASTHSIPRSDSLP